MPLFLVLSGIAAAVELDERARWVEDAPVEVGGATLVLRAGLLFPVEADPADAETGPAGFVFVGDAAFTAPLDSPGAALAVRAGLPDGDFDSSGRAAPVLERPD